MARQVDYDDSPRRAHERLTAEEVAGLLAAGGRPVSKDPARVMHLLTRLDATLRAHARQVTDMHRDIEAISSAARRHGTPLQVAVDALAALTDAQREQVLDVTVSRRMAELAERIADADRARLAARSEGNRIRFALERLAGDPSLTEDARRAVRGALAALPPPVRAGADTAPRPDGGVGTQPAAPAAPAPAPSPAVPVPASAPAAVDPHPAAAAPPVTFAWLEPSDTEPSWQLQVFLDGVCAGSLDITADTHTAAGLAVDLPARRRGLGSALLDEARRRFPDLRPGPAVGDGPAFLAGYRDRTGWPA